MELASGVVLVARMNRSTRERIRRLEKMVKAAEGTIFGVVATGASTGIGYDYYRSKYYSTNGQGGRFGRLRQQHGYADADAALGQAQPPSAESSVEAAASAADRQQSDPDQIRPYWRSRNAGRD
jgi:hypothetical protein